MFRRTLIFCSVIVVFASAVIVNLAILGLLSVQELGQSLGKLVSIIAVSTIAILLILALVRLGTKRSSERANSSLRIPGLSLRREDDDQGERQEKEPSRAPVDPQ